MFVALFAFLQFLKKYIYFTAEAYKSGQLQEQLEKAMCSWSFSGGRQFNSTLDLFGEDWSVLYNHHFLHICLVMAKTMYIVLIWIQNKNLCLWTTVYFWICENKLLS